MRLEDLTEVIRVEPTYEYLLFPISTNLKLDYQEWIARIAVGSVSSFARNL